MGYLPESQLNATVQVYRTPQGAGKVRNAYGEVLTETNQTLIATLDVMIHQLTQTDVFQIEGGLNKVTYRMFVQYYQYVDNVSDDGKHEAPTDIQQDDRVVITSVLRGPQIDIGRNLRVQSVSNPGMLNDVVEVVLYYETGGN